MELDDLKQSWDEQTNQDFKTVNNNFMELIHNKSYSPVATLKSKFQQQIIMIPVFIGILIYGFIKKPEMLNNILMWVFVAIVFVISGFCLFNYTIIGRLQNTNSPVKEAIEKNILTLENGSKKYLIFSRIVFVLFLILLELLMYIHKAPDYEIWYSVSIYFRIPLYLLCFFLSYSLGKYFYNKQFGQHISYLRELVNKMS